MHVQIKKIQAAHMDVWLPIEDEVNEWLRANNITADQLIKVTLHSDKCFSLRYPAPHDHVEDHYALVYYLSA